MQYDDVTNNSVWRTYAILKIFFRYISAPYNLINAKFGERKQYHTQTQVVWPKWQISKLKMANCRHFENVW